MNFRTWLTEWEGNTFNQASSYVNQSPPFPVRSKYVAKSEPDEDEIGQEVEKPAKKFGFDKNDPLLDDKKYLMKKKMKV